jgi:UDP-N-acetylmuramate--alanine ligase
VFAARETSDGESDLAAKELVERIRETGVDARFGATLDQILGTLDDSARPGDVLLTMGAGDINRIHHEFHRRLQRHPGA